MRHCEAQKRRCFGPFLSLVDLNFVILVAGVLYPYCRSVGSSELL